MSRLIIIVLLSVIAGTGLGYMTGTLIAEIKEWRELKRHE